MLISEKKLKKVNVETQSGQNLGKISGFELETDTGIIEKYYVKSKISIPGIYENKLIVSKEQIISFDQEKMIVNDNLIKVESNEEEYQEVKKIERTEAIITSKKA